MNIGIWMKWWPCFEKRITNESDGILDSMWFSWFYTNAGYFFRSWIYSSHSHMESNQESNNEKERGDSQPNPEAGGAQGSNSGDHWTLWLLLPGSPRGQGAFASLCWVMLLQCQWISLILCPCLSRSRAKETHFRLPGSGGGGGFWGRGCHHPCLLTGSILPSSCPFSALFHTYHPLPDSPTPRILTTSWSCRSTSQPPSLCWGSLPTDAAQHQLALLAFQVL